MINLKKSETIEWKGFINTFSLFSSVLFSYNIRDNKTYVKPSCGGLQAYPHQQVVEGIPNGLPICMTNDVCTNDK